MHRGHHHDFAGMAMSFGVGLSARILATVSSAFFSATCCTSAASLEVRLAGATAAMAGSILCSTCVRLPSSTLSMAPLTAPQELCPSTTMAFEPETLQANSRLPMMSVFT